MAAPEERQRNLRAIMNWSIQQSGDGTSLSNFAEMNPERRRWLAEALDSMATAPSETEVLKKSLDVLRKYSSSIPLEGQNAPAELNEEEMESVVKAIEQIQYFVEDLDHAKDLIPLNGVDVIKQYLHHANSDIVLSTCELVATATQNNPLCQSAFLSTMPRLLTLLDCSDVPSGTRIKALYAISCLTRMFLPGLSELIKLDGISVLLHCMQSEVTKLVIKSIFLIMSYFSNTVENIPAPLMERMTTIIDECVSLLRSYKDPEVSGHLLATLNCFITHHEAAREHCKNPGLRLKELLVIKLAELPADPIDNHEMIHQIQRSCFNEM